MGALNSSSVAAVTAKTMAAERIGSSARRDLRGMNSRIPLSANGQGSVLKGKVFQGIRPLGAVVQTFSAEPHTPRPKKVMVGALAPEVVPGNFPAVGRIGSAFQSA